MPGDRKPDGSRFLHDLTIRPFASHEDYEACTNFQEEVWGEGFSEKVSAAILKIANRLGGLAAGAFDDEGLLHGFVFGLTGVVDGSLVHWSDMLAVRSQGRDLGLGTRLKLYQRDFLLERGVREMRWTFDPLQGRNAHVNFSKLGVVCREYVENMYGQTDSPLHRGIGTDRLVATWQMESERVEARLSGEAEESPLAKDPQTFRKALGSSDGPVDVLPLVESGSLSIPGEPVLGLDGPSLRLAVPGFIDGMMESDLPLAVRWREATRKAFLHYFSRGYEAVEFTRGDPVSSYLLVHPGAEAPGDAWESRAGKRA